jgi:hypothetical protein
VAPFIFYFFKKSESHFRVPLFVVAMATIQIINLKPINNSHVNNPREGIQKSSKLLNPQNDSSFLLNCSLPLTYLFSSIYLKRLPRLVPQQPYFPFTLNIWMFSLNSTAFEDEVHGTQFWARWIGAF